jgi:predicted enzyme related to lactoylglutathione lyase
MITAGHVALVVSDMDAALQFYTGMLGLKLARRYADDWVTVEAGRGLTIGLHPASRHYPAPGTRGSLMIGLEVDESIETAVERLAARGVRFSGPIVRDPRAGAFANFTDPDGNALYLWESLWR